MAGPPVVGRAAGGRLGRGDGRSGRAAALGGGPHAARACRSRSTGERRPGAVVVADDGGVAVEVWAGEVLDEVTLRSYCLGAVHQALGWVRSEGIAVDGDGEVARSDRAFLRHPAGAGHSAGAT